MSALPGGIPKVFHRIWLGSAVPDEVEQFGRAWLDLHPGWTLHTWREWDMPALRNQFWFDRGSSYASQADIARLELLYRFGGVYVDTDQEPLRSIEELIAHAGCFFGSEDGQWLGTSIIGCAPQHPFLAQLIDGVPDSILTNVDASPNVQTGPQYVTKQWMEYKEKHDDADIAVFPSAIFYPYHFSEPERAGGPFPDAYAVHHWAKTWVDRDDG